MKRDFSGNDLHRNINNRRVPAAEGISVETFDTVC